ncbi:restriction endonuclease [Aliarcobacter thereius]|uniref:restriction endonuclease n=1 Tax=Aliarcobacter thereius TaxID=544718 RepID=UPI0008248CAD|nr:restriction endonuclease [Aliarcobacter thereius]OCL90574.1 hypothetical protein AAX25_01672 [Aliarcobacter thereius]
MPDFFITLIIIIVILALLYDFWPLAILIGVIYIVSNFSKIKLNIETFYNTHQYEIIIILALIIVSFLFIKYKNIVIKDLESELLKLKKEKSKEYTPEELSNMKKAGDAFEILVGQSYEADGYEVDYRGLRLDYLDGGIDLVATKDNKILLIQCKYWKKKDSITHNMVKEFYGNCNFYIDNNNLDRNNITCIYAVAKHDSISFQAYEVFKINYNKCRYKVYSNL